MAVEIRRRRPQHDGRRRLVRPAEIAPEQVEVDHRQRDADDKQRHSDYQALAYLALVGIDAVAVEKLGNLQTRGAESGIAGSNRQDHHAQNRENAAECAEHLHCRIKDHRCRGFGGGGEQCLHIGIE